MTSVPVTDLLADLRRGLPVLVAAVLVGGLVGGGRAWVAPRRHAATATLLVVSRHAELSGRSPASAAQLAALLDAGTLAEAAASAGLEPGALGGAVAVTAQPSGGLFDVAVTLTDGEAARRAADASARALAARLEELASRRSGLALDTVAPAFASARQAREVAEAAYLAHVRSGTLERAKEEVRRVPGPVTAAAVGAAQAERDGLRFALDRAVADERAAAGTRARVESEFDALAPRVALWSEAQPAVAVRRGAARAAVAGGAIALVIALAGLLLLRGLRRPAGGVAAA